MAASSSGTNICPPQACITTKGAPDKSYPHFSLRLLRSTSLLAAAGSPLQECKSIAFHQKVPHRVKMNIMMLLQRSHPCCTFALFCLLKTTPRLSSCKDWTHLQHYWPYHWRKSELPCRGKLEFRAKVTTFRTTTLEINSWKNMIDAQSQADELMWCFRFQQLLQKSDQPTELLVTQIKAWCCSYRCVLLYMSCW